MAEEIRTITESSLKAKRLKRRRRQKRIQWSIFGGLLLILVLVMLYMFTPMSKINDVTVSGNKHVETKTILKNVDAKGKRIYALSKSSIQSTLEENPIIKSVDVSKHFPGTIEIVIHEHPFVGQVKDKKGYHPILANGHELKSYDGNVPDEAPVLEGFEGKKLDKVVSAMADMKRSIRAQIAEVAYEPIKNKQNRIVLYTKDKIQVVGDLNTISDKMKYYPQMSQSLERDPSGKLKREGYIDLSVGASFIPYKNSSGNKQSESDKAVEQDAAMEDRAKDELQSALNKINESSNKKTENKQKNP